MSNLQVSNASLVIDRSPILNDASLTLNSGIVTAIIGPNGAGKSTLLNVASGALSPTSGQVEINGVPASELSAHQLARRRAVMPQDSIVAFPFTVREVVEMGRTAWSTTTAENARIVAEALDLVDMLPLANREITTLSGGERQRVAFARIIAQTTPIHSGSVLMFDEPTSAMDIGHAERTMRMLRTLAAQGAAVGIALHDLDAAAAYADYVVLMSRGRVQCAGPTLEVCTAENLSQVYRTPIEVFTRNGTIHVAPARAVHGQTENGQVRDVVQNYA